MTIRVGVFQIASHLAVSVGGQDYLQEPLLPLPGQPSLTRVARHRLELRAPLRSIKERYIQWMEERLALMLEWLATKGELPSVVVFPEGSIPFELLPIVRTYSERTGIVFFAGTHTPRLGSDAGTFYKRSVGVPGRVLKSLKRIAEPPVAVLPIVTPDQSELHPKLTPSIFERNEFHRGDPGNLSIAPVEIAGLRIAPLVCAEALQLVNLDLRPDLVVIVAFEREPSRFNKYIQRFVDNQVPVVLANDARFGGSGVFTAHDKRAAEWWYDAPNHGCLPTGEAYLECELDLGATAVEVGVSNPSQPFRLSSLVPILSADDPLLPLERKAAEFASNRNGEGLLAVRVELDKSAAQSAVVSRRWDYLENLASTGRLSDGAIGILGQHLVTSTLPSLRSLETELCTIGGDGIRQLLDSDLQASLEDEEIATLFRLRRQLEQHAGATQKSSLPRPVADVGQLPFGRDEILREMTDFATRSRETVMVVTGMQAIGKTTALAAGLVQSESKTLTIDCHPGTTADYLYEYLLKAAGRVPSDTAPRTTFAIDDIVDALRPFDVLWLQNLHNLVEYGEWHNNALGHLMEVLIEGHKRASTCVLLESRRALNLTAPLGMAINRKRIWGLQDRYGVALLDQRLRRADVPVDLIPESQRSEIVRLVDGHPGMIILCADVCARTSAEAVIGDLRGRRGFYLSAVTQLVTELGLSKRELQCLNALAQCREPISVKTLQALVGEDRVTEVAAQLVDSCLVERTRSGRISLAKLLREVQFDAGVIRQDVLKEFHRSACDDFVGLYNSSNRLEAFVAAVEANYHAALGELPLPLNLDGMLDGLSGAARLEYDAERYRNVIRLLGPIVNERSPEDLAAMLADAYAWTDRFEEAFVLADSVVKRNRSFRWLYTRACEAGLRSRRYDYARRALDKAERAAPGSYEVALFKGRLAERSGDRDGAIEHYREASEKTETDCWPYFYYARALISRGRPAEALTVIDRGRAMSAEFSSRNARVFERAMLEKELLALIQTGEYEAAQAILSVLESSHNLRPEIVLSIAFVRAFFTEDKSKVIEVYERAIANLDVNQSHKAHVRAQIHLLRGRLFDRAEDFGRAEEEYERSAALDEHNVQVKINLMQVLIKIARAAKNSQDANAAQSAAKKASEVANSILKYNAGQEEAIYAQENLYHEFGIQ